MVDLHCHILPGIDDGAKTVSDSIQLIQKEIEDGVDTIAVTPHYYGHKRTINEFLEQRLASYKILIRELKEHNIKVNLKLGCEVYFTPTFLKNADKHKLCYEGTHYLLIEFPIQDYYDWIPNAIYQLELEKIVPVIAHIERYPFIQSHPERVSELVDYGAVIQTNADSIIHILGRQRLLNWIANDFIHLVATDTHSVKKRPPNLFKAMKIIEHKLGVKKAKGLINNAYRILENEPNVESEYERE